jgi:uncharacterized linocin/CFP29 family protein
MQNPLRISFRHMKSSVALESRVRKLAARLETFSPQIVACHIVIDGPDGPQSQGGCFDVRMDISVPGREIAVHRARPHHLSHQDPYVALRDAYRAARRKLQDYERERRLDVKSHERS